MNLNQALFDAISNRDENQALVQELLDERHASHHSEEPIDGDCTMCAVIMVSDLLLNRVVLYLERGDQLAAKRALAEIFLDTLMIGVIAGKRLVEVANLERLQ